LWSPFHPREVWLFVPFPKLRLGTSFILQTTRSCSRHLIGQFLFCRDYFLSNCDRSFYKILKDIVGLNTIYMYGTRVKRWVLLVEQELPTLPEHLSSSRVFSLVWSLVFCVMFCRSLFVIFLYAILLSAFPDYIASV
jgi:hypothetical protein